MFIGPASLSREKATDSLSRQRLVTVVNIAWMKTVIP